MISVSHPTGNSFVRALLKELNDHGDLNLYYTTIGCGKDSLLRKFCKRRTYPVPSKKILRHSWPEIRRLIGSRLPFSSFGRNSPIDWIYGRLDKWVADQLPKHKPMVIHCYEDGAFHTFEKAGEMDIHRSYELPIAHHETLRRLLLKEAERYPDWEPTLLATSEPEEKLHRKNRELEMADVICCPSQFVMDSLPTKLKEKKPCFVAPFGTPQTTPMQKITARDKNHPVRFLFVGSMSQRKGLADLLKAFRKVNTRQAELFILGSPLMPMAFYRSHKVDFHHKPTCSNDKVLALMAKCDVLVLPSIAEGRALVQQEAMSQGLPILVTPNAGGQDLVKEEETGLLVEPGSPSMLAEKLEWFVRNQENIPAMGQAAREHAESYSWKAYAESIIKKSFAVERTQQRG